MIKVDKHISDLLYKHDCVIVPDLGGFVANYASAKIHPTQHTFIPPSKKIVFNKNLKNNDGLLANHVACVEKISYTGALKYINQFTSTTNSQLKQGAKVLIDDVGTLYFDTERNLQFEAGNTNYLLDAFGLAQFQSPAIKRDNIGKRIEKEFKDRGAIPSGKKKIKIKYYVAIAIILPLIFGMIWIPLQTDLLKKISYSGLNPFSSNETKKNIVPENTKTKSIKIEPVPSSTMNDTLKYSKLNLTGSDSTQPVTAKLLENKNVGIVKADSTSVSVASVNNMSDFKFHIIAGCFQIEENANNFVASLQNQNVPASIIGNRNGLFIVSAGDYATRNEASEGLMQLRKSQPEAWLLKK